MSLVSSISFKSTRGAQPARRFDALEDSIIQAIEAIKRALYRGGWFTTGEVVKAKYVARPWEIVLCDPTAGGFTVLLPDPTKPQAIGAFIAIKNDSNSVNAITVNTIASTIDRGTFYLMNVTRLNVVFWSNGKEWKRWSVS